MKKLFTNVKVVYCKKVMEPNKGCMQEFLYIRNTHPRLKLTSRAGNWSARMKVYTHCSPSRTKKRMKFMNSCLNWPWQPKRRMIQKEVKERFLSTDLYMTMKKRMKQKNSETIELLLAKSEAGKLFQMFFFKKVDNLGILLRFLFWD